MIKPKTSPKSSPSGKMLALTFRSSAGACIKRYANQIIAKIAIITPIAKFRSARPLSYVVPLPFRPKFLSSVLGIKIGSLPTLTAT